MIKPTDIPDEVVEAAAIAEYEAWRKREDLYDETLPWEDAEEDMRDGVHTRSSCGGHKERAGVEMTMIDAVENAKKNGFIYAAIEETWGPRCPDFDPSCWCCRAWAEYDQMERLRAALQEADNVRSAIRATGVKRTPILYQAVMAFDAARAALEGK